MEQEGLNGIGRGRQGRERNKGGAANTKDILKKCMEAYYLSRFLNTHMHTCI